MKRRPSRRAGGYAASAAFMMSERIYKRDTVLRQLRKTLEFWAYYDNLELPKPLRREVILDFARRFRDHLRHEDPGSGLSPANGAARRAVRELLTKPAPAPVQGLESM